MKRKNYMTLVSSLKESNQKSVSQLEELQYGTPTGTLILQNKKKTTKIPTLHVKSIYRLEIVNYVTHYCQVTNNCNKVGIF